MIGGTGYLKLRSLSEYADLSVRTLRGLLKDGMPHYRVGGVILVKVSEFDEWVGDHYRAGFDAQAVARELLED